MTNRYLSGMSLVRETEFEELKHFQHIKELFSDD